jgi:hypothetical protein
MYFQTSPSSIVTKTTEGSDISSLFTMTPDGCGGKTAAIIEPSSILTYLGELSK